MPGVAVDVLTEVVIDRPCPEVAAFSSDPDHAPLWYANIKSVRWETVPPLQVGSRIAFVAQFLGRQISYTYEIADVEPDRRLVMSTAEGPFPMETTYTWAPAGTDSTRMTLRNRGEPRGFGKMAAPVMATAIRRANQKDLGRLKRLMER
jgi:uncharacterized membrane protein